MKNAALFLVFVLASLFAGAGQADSIKKGAFSLSEFSDLIVEMEDAIVLLEAAPQPVLRLAAVRGVKSVVQRYGKECQLTLNENDESFVTQVMFAIRFESLQELGVSPETAENIAGLRLAAGAPIAQLEAIDRRYLEGTTVALEEGETDELWERSLNLYMDTTNTFSDTFEAFEYALVDPKTTAFDEESNTLTLLEGCS